jgi:hypothetical protein
MTIKQAVRVSPPRIKQRIKAPLPSRRFTSVREEIYEHPCPAQPFAGEAA